MKKEKGPNVHSYTLKAHKQKKKEEVGQRKTPNPNTKGGPSIALYGTSCHIQFQYLQGR